MRPDGAVEETEHDREEFCGALRQLRDGLLANQRRSERMLGRIDELEQACADGRPISAATAQGDEPALVQMLTESIDALYEHGLRVRRSAARLMHREGLSMERIAVLFGVSRQRVSVLLRDRHR